MFHNQSISGRASGIMLLREFAALHSRSNKKAVIASEAKQSRRGGSMPLSRDCFVAPLLAMTKCVHGVGSKQHEGWIKRLPQSQDRAEADDRSVQDTGQSQNSESRDVYASDESGACQRARSVPTISLCVPSAFAAF